MNMDVIEVRQGTARPITINFMDEATSEPKAYAGTEGLRVRIWQGDDQTSLIEPSVTWQDAPNGVAGFVLTGEQTASLAPARYYLLAEVQEGGEWSEAITCWLKITPAPGTALPLSSYCTLEDLERLCPRVDLEQAVGVQAGFAEARHQARQWIDSQLLKKDSRNRGFRGLLPEVRTWLATDALMVDALVIEIAARKALSIIFATAYVPGAKDSEKLTNFGALQERKAETLFFNNAFELDTNGDGVADYWIECNKIVMRGYNYGCV